MVDAEKAKQPKVKKNKNSNLPDIWNRSFNGIFSYWSTLYWL